MSEREKWMLSEEEMRDSVGNAYTGSPGTGLSEMVHRTGLRAQITVLEEMTAGQTGHWVDRIKAEIERLRKEIG